MRILILGGTVFLGRHLAAAALARGHAVTLFNRGKSGPELFPEAEHLRGDRTNDLSALEGRNWDAVIDTCGYVPRVVRASAERLAGAVERYVFISTVSVYADTSQIGITEEAPTGTTQDPTTEEVTGETYGPLKVLCEAAVERALPGRALVIRPGLIVGPHDPSDRFAYWPRRLARGGEVLAPGNPDAPVQFIDVRDLAEWTVRLVESSATGIFNATGPEQPLTMRAVLEACRKVAGTDATLTWIPDDFLLEAKVAPYSEFPLWIPDDPKHAGFSRMSIRKAFDAGLTFRPLAETAQDTLAWDASLPVEKQHRGSLTPEREAELLMLWKKPRSVA